MAAMSASNAACLEVTTVTLCPFASNAFAARSTAYEYKIGCADMAEG